MRNRTVTQARPVQDSRLVLCRYHLIDTSYTGSSSIILIHKEVLIYRLWYGYDVMRSKLELVMETREMGWDHDRWS